MERKQQLMEAKKPGTCNPGFESPNARSMVAWSGARRIYDDDCFALSIPHSAVFLLLQQAG